MRGLRPTFRVAPAINPSSSLLPVTRAEGITLQSHFPGRHVEWHSGLYSAGRGPGFRSGAGTSSCGCCADVSCDKGSRAETLNLSPEPLRGGS